MRIKRFYSLSVKDNNTLILASSVLFGVTFMSGVVLGSGVVFADNDSVVDDVNIVVPTACTLAGTLNTAHNATINPGTYQADIGTTTLKALCNDSAGFAIYATGYTGNTIGETNSNKLIGQNTSELIPTGIGTSGDSQWAMKLTTDSGATYPITIGSAPNTSGGADASFSSYHVVPNEYTKVAYRTEGTDVGNNATGSTLTTTYAVNIASTQAADTYSGKVIYTLVHPNTAPAPVVCNPSGTTVGTNTSTDIVCMQDISSTNKSSILSSMTTGTQYTLTDKRDQKSYTISKLADGNIWMTQNLDLDLDSSKTYTNEDTDLGWNGTSYNTASWTPERSTYTTGTTTWGLYNSTTGNHDGFYHPESYDPGDLYWNGALSDWNDWDAYYQSCAYDSDTWLYSDCDESLNPLSTYTSSTGTTQYHLGNFYNWNAAIASNDSSGYGVYDSGTDSYINTQANQSICPTGWTLPIGGYFDSNAPSKSFQYLIEQYGWDDNSYTLSNNRKMWESPIYLGLSGFWYGMLEDVGYYVLPWSSVASNAEDAYVLYAGSDGGVNPANYYDRDDGNVVRCVVR